MRLVVAWHTVEANRARVLVAFSDDAGARFDEPVEVDTEQPLGRVGVVLTDEGDAVVIWLAGGWGERGEQADIKLRRVTRDGRRGETITAVGTSPSRASGFPRMVRAGDDLVLAWVEPVKPSRVRAAILPVRAVPPVGAPGAPGEMGGALKAPAGHHRAWDREAGSLAPDYSALTLDGRSLSLADLRGEAVLLNLWATWCEPCRRETPDLAALQQQFGADGLRVVGVSVDVDLAPEKLRDYIQREKITYTILHDPEDRASGLFIGGALLPASFLFNREGVLVWSQVGLLRRDDPGLLEALAKALARSAVRPDRS
jgi:peroxiredoxin